MTAAKFWDGSSSGSGFPATGHNGRKKGDILLFQGKRKKRGHSAFSGKSRMSPFFQASFRRAEKFPG
jgi:hypothetical protein